MTYDVIENDIALLNVYFGESTAMGEHDVEKEVSYHSNLEYERNLKRSTIEILVDMAAWFGETTHIFLDSIVFFRRLFGHKCPFPGRDSLLGAESIHRCRFHGSCNKCFCSGHLWAHHDT